MENVLCVFIPCPQIGRKVVGKILSGPLTSRPVVFTAEQPIPKQLIHPLQFRVVGENIEVSAWEVDKRFLRCLRNVMQERIKNADSVASFQQQCRWEVERIGGQGFFCTFLEFPPQALNIGLAFQDPTIVALFNSYRDALRLLSNHDLVASRMVAYLDACEQALNQGHDFAVINQLPEFEAVAECVRIIGQHQAWPLASLRVIMINNPTSPSC